MGEPLFSSIEPVSKGAAIVREHIASILVVDDQETNRDLLKRRLERKGYKVETADGGVMALNCIARQKYDLVMLDVEMPGMTGLDVLSEIRGTRSHLQLPVIMVTGRTESEDIIKALSLGANDYITKPVDVPVAVARIQTHLSLKWTGEALRESEERYALAADGANDGLWDWDLTTNQVYFSSRWKAMLGFEEGEIGNQIDEWFKRVHPDDIESLRAKISEHMDGKSPHFEKEHRILHRDGSYRWMVSRGLGVRTENGPPTRMAGSQRDVTTERVSDPLTQLPNRLLFQDRLGCLLERAKRQKDCFCALLFLDINRFNLINTSFGHAVGDSLLIAISKQLDASLRSADTVSRFGGVHTVARLEGDQFCILLDDIKNAANASRVAERLLDQLELPFKLGDQEIFVTACIGIALSKPGDTDPDSLIRNAEAAKNWARMTGKARFELFDSAMRNQMVSRMQLETELRWALERQELHNYYQMIVSMKTGRIVGFEALVRWKHPVKGIILPGEFIPLAEETGMILDLGDQVMNDACSHLQNWQKAFGASLSITVSVNLSCRELIHGELIERIEKMLKSTSIDLRMLKLEMTESAIMRDVSFARNQLERLRAMGIKVAIDDFGTGYSSLSHLVQFPADTLKIDRSFVNGMEDGGENAEIVSTIISLAHNLGLDVVAEGVETAGQWRQLAKLGCDFVQGFYIGKPMDEKATEELLSSVTRDQDQWLVPPALRAAPEEWFPPEQIISGHAHL
jgi:diguanylate cyclase (GGDEF)-like protein/PAS domain S-box-containing protein